MKVCIVLLWSMLASFVMSAQQDIELSEERDGNKVLVYAQNNRDEAVELTISAEIKGYSTSTVFPYTQKIAANSKVWAFTLTEAPGVENAYRLSVSYSVPRKTTGEVSPVTENTRLTGIEINPGKVNVFTKDGCGRCASAIKLLTEKNIAFLELNTSVHYPNTTLMFNKLESSGFKGGSVTMPVIVYKDKVYYNITDMKTLIGSFAE